MALLDEIQKAQVLNLLGERLQGLLDVPTSAARFMASPTGVLDAITGKTAMPKEKGFAEGATGLPQRENLSVLDPANRAYMEGYFQGEPFGYAAALSPLAASGATKLSDKLVQTITGNPMATGAKVIDYAAMPFGNAIQSKYVPNVKAGEEMLVTHNISPEKLQMVQELGAMPVPSLGISKVSSFENYHPLEKFGDITLIGNKALAQPSRTNPVFAADAYTVRKPYIETRLDNVGEKYVKDTFSEPFGKFSGDMESEIQHIANDFKSNIEGSVAAKAKFLKDNNLLPDSNAFDSVGKFRMSVRDNFYQAVENNPNLLQKYYDWENNLVNDVKNAGGQVNYEMFKGYTPSGKKRYVPANLENIVKEMSSGKAGDEGNYFSVASLRAKLTPNLKSEKDILKAREKLVDPEKFESMKYDIESKFDDLKGEVRNFLDEKGSRIDADSFFEDLALGQTGKYDYSRDIGKQVPDSLKAKIQGLSKELKQFPTEYFEIKPKRGVNLSEFEGALVPNDISQNAIDILESGGVKEILKYATPEEKIGLLDRFNKQMFGLAPVGLGYGLLGSDTEQ